LSTISEIRVDLLTEVDLPLKRDYHIRIDLPMKVDLPIGKTTNLIDSPIQLLTDLLPKLTTCSKFDYQLTTKKKQ